MTNIDTEKFRETSWNVIEREIIPLIFTPETLAEMDQEYSERADFYRDALIISFDEDFEHCGGVKPQLDIRDPRISREILHALPEKITVPYEGQSIEVPLRVYHSNAHADISRWLGELETKRVSRCAIRDLVPALMRHFNLESGIDYVIAYSSTRRADGEKKQFIVHTFNDKVQGRESEVQAFVENALSDLLPESSVNVSLMKPAIFKRRRY